MKEDDREESSSYPVKSKYFDSNSAMDESLSDFQETKKTFAGPKNSVKSKTNKPKKAPKRIRGQKDIRTALRSTKNELESYSKDFEKVCKKAGIDVDSEQLQLAIALSKSLQDTASTSCEASDQKSQVVNTQDRIGKIRTTLQEYGFKVPEVKIATNTRKIRKHRKDYKLISTSDSEKEEIIANKYSQVLFQNITHCSLYCSDIDSSSTQLYYLATNVTYDVLKNTDTFYVDNLVEKSTNTGNLLKDWSNIPGRPKSPKPIVPCNMNFSEIECSQDELDIVLSGSLKRSKNVLKNKINCLTNDKMCRIDVDKEDIVIIENKEESNKDVIVIENEKEINKNNHENILKPQYNVEKSPKLVTTATQYRSYSPDMFDDDVSILDDSTHSIVQKERNSEVHNTNTKINIEVMDITGCVQSKALKSSSISEAKQIELNQKTDGFIKSTESIQILPEDHTSIVGSQLSQNKNVTLCKSNDLMEITECVGILSQPLQNNFDFTLLPDIIEENTVGDEAVDNLDECNDVILSPNQVTYNETKDLTESPNYHDDHMATNDETLKVINTDQGMDLLQSSDTSDELPYVNVTGKKRHSLDKTIIIVDINEYAKDNKKSTNLQSQAEIHIDLTQDLGITNVSKNHSQNHGHSGNTREPKKTCSREVHDKCDLGKVDPSQNSKRQSNATNSDDSTDPLISLKPDSEEHIHWEYEDCDIHRVRDLEKLLVCLSRNCKEVIDNVPVEYHRANCGYKSCKPGKVDLTQSPEKECYIVDEYSNYPNPTKTSLEGCSGSQSNHGNLDTIDSLEDMPGPSTRTNVVKEIPRDSPNSSHKVCKPRKLNLSISPIKRCSDNEINLTQSSGTSEELNQTISNKDSAKLIDGAFIDTDENDIFDDDLEKLRNSQRCDSMSKNYDVSIDYDDYVPIQSHDEHNGFNDRSVQSVVNELAENPDECSNDNSQLLNCSQYSEVFEISDKELDYSMHHSKLEKPVENFAFGGISVIDNLSDFCSSKKSIDVNNYVPNSLNDNEELPMLNKMNNDRYKEISPIKHRRITEIATPQKPTSSNVVTVLTPQNSELVIKTTDVTPMLNYELMSTPDIHKELDKYGIKPFKRKRAIQLLTHIYNQTHPTIESYTEELASPPKRRKPNDDLSMISPRKLISPRKILNSPPKNRNVNEENDDENYKKITEKYSINHNANKTIDDTDKEKTTKVNETKKGKANDSLENNAPETQSRSKVVEVTQASISKEIECKPEDWVFQKREKAKVHSCRVPLHIAFYNYVSSRRELREAILCYEPVEIDVIHKELVGYGHRYDPKELLKFLDKKCITVKTTDNDARSQKKLSSQMIQS